MTDRSTSAGFLAFPDFHTALLWYKLFGRPEPEVDPQPDDQPSDPDSQESDQEGETETNDPSERSEHRSEPDIQDTENERSEQSTGEPNEQETSERSEQVEPKDEDGELDNDSNSEPNNDPFEESDESETPIPDYEPDNLGDPDLDTDRPDSLADFSLTDPPVPEPLLPGLSILAGPNGQIQTLRQFPTWFDFITCVRDTPAAWPTRKSQKISPERLKFTGTQSFDQALRMALTDGWPEGRTRLRDLFASVNPQPQITNAFDFDVAGAYPLVPLYCAGDPACFVTDQNLEHRAARPVVRIDFNIITNWRVSTDSIMTRGAAVLSFANTLESLGYSTELRIIGGCHDFKRQFWYSIIYKNAGEPLDLDRATFAIAHPSVLRRLYFALLEQHLEFYPTCKEDYGFPIHEPFPDQDSNPQKPIFISSPETNNETPETAQFAVEQAALEAGFTPHDKPLDLAA